MGQLTREAKKKRKKIHTLANRPLSTNLWIGINKGECLSILIKKGTHNTEIYHTSNKADGLSLKFKLRPHQKFHCFNQISIH